MGCTLDPREVQDQAVAHTQPHIRLPSGPFSYQASLRSAWQSSTPGSPAAQLAAAAEVHSNHTHAHARTFTYAGMSLILVVSGRFLGVLGAAALLVAEIARVRPSDLDLDCRNSRRSSVLKLNSETSITFDSEASLP